MSKKKKKVDPKEYMLDTLVKLPVEAVVKVHEGEDSDEALINHLRDVGKFNMDDKNLVAWLIKFPNRDTAAHFCQSVLGKTKDYRVLESVDTHEFIIEFYTAIVISIESIKLFRAQWETLCDTFNGVYIGWKATNLRKQVDNAPN